MVIIFIVFKDGLKNEYKLLTHLGYLIENESENNSAFN